MKTLDVVLDLKFDSCPYKLGLRKVKMYGGPYKQRPSGTFGVKMAAEINTACDANIPTKDFSVPNTEDLLKGLERGLWALSMGMDVYVGCMGGIGRTGLYMAAMAKVLGLPDPIDHVREHYNEHAVETTEQARFIELLDVRSLKNMAMVAGIIRTAIFWK